MYHNIDPINDRIVLQSVQSYLAETTGTSFSDPRDKMIATKNARDYLYSVIVQKVPRLAACCLDANMRDSEECKSIYRALSNHVMDPAFVNVLMQFLSDPQSASEEKNRYTGALLVKIMADKINERTASTETKSTKKGEKAAEVEKPNFDDLKHIRQAISVLLGTTSNIVSARCGNLNELEALAISSALVLNSVDTIREIIDSDLPITADLFDIVDDPTELIKASLLLEKTQVPKLSSNQLSFMESLKRWVYGKLNNADSDQIWRFLIATYGSAKPDVTKYYIQIKDCGNQYPDLLMLAKNLINQ